MRKFCLLTIRCLVFIFSIVLLSGTSSEAHTDTKRINLTFNIIPVFKIMAESETGTRNVNLGSVLPGIGAQSKMLQVSVFTNTNDSYRLFHELRDPMTSSGGTIIPDNELNMAVSSGSAGGLSLLSGESVVSPNRVPIFSSNPDGGYDSFSIRYSLSNKQAFEAGDYFGHVYIDVEKL